MDKEQIERILDNAEMNTIDRLEEPSGDLPYAVSVGFVELMGFSFKVYQLNNGQRVVDAESVEQFFKQQINE